MLYRGVVAISRHSPGCCCTLYTSASRVKSFIDQYRTTGCASSSPSRPPQRFRGEIRAVIRAVTRGPDVNVHSFPQRVEEFPGAVVKKNQTEAWISSTGCRRILFGVASTGTGTGRRHRHQQKKYIIILCDMLHMYMPAPCPLSVWGGQYLILRQKLSHRTGAC